MGFGAAGSSNSRGRGDRTRPDAARGDGYLRHRPMGGDGGAVRGGVVDGVVPVIVWEEAGEVTPAMWNYLMGGVRMSSVPSVVFTGPDKALLDRSARAAEAAAKALNWETIVLPKQRKARKLEYDRLMRDAHDLRLMGVRL